MNNNPDTIDSLLHQSSQWLTSAFQETSLTCPRSHGENPASEHSNYDMLLCAYFPGESDPEWYLHPDYSNDVLFNFDITSVERMNVFSQSVANSSGIMFPSVPAQVFDSVFSSPQERTSLLPYAVRTSGLINESPGVCLVEQVNRAEMQSVVLNNSPVKRPSLSITDSLAALHTIDQKPTEACRLLQNSRQRDLAILQGSECLVHNIRQRARLSVVPRVPLLERTNLLFTSVSARANISILSRFVLPSPLSEQYPSFRRARPYDELVSYSTSPSQLSRRHSPLRSIVRQSWPNTALRRCFEGGVATRVPTLGLNQGVRHRAMHLSHLVVVSTMEVKTVYVSENIPRSQPGARHFSL